MPPTHARPSKIDRALAEDGVPFLVPKRQVAELLHCAPRTVERYVAAGRLQAIRTVPGKGSGRLLVPRASLAAFLETLTEGAC